MNKREEFVKFYSSKAWKKIRNFIYQRDKGMCVKCSKPGKEVHHIIPLRLSNIHDPLISLNDKNLELLCLSCHANTRIKSTAIRSDVKFDAEGNLIKI